MLRQIYIKMLKSNIIKHNQEVHTITIEKNRVTNSPRGIIKLSFEKKSLNKKSND